MRKFLGKSDEKEKFSALQQEDRLHTKLEQRKKNSNERELERFEEEERQENIKQRLEAFRKQKQKSFWESNIFKQDSILKNDRPILKEKNIFNMKTTKQGNMFFK